MSCPEYDDIPSTPTPDGGRTYRLDRRTVVVVREIPAGSIPGVDEPCFRYTFASNRGVGVSDIAADAEGLRRIMDAWILTTGPDYRPARWSAPDGSPPDIRPPIQDLLRKAMEAARPRRVHGGTLGYRMDEGGTVRRIGRDEEG